MTGHGGPGLLKPTKPVIRPRTMSASTPRKMNALSSTGFTALSLAQEGSATVN